MKKKMELKNKIGVLGFGTLLVFAVLIATAGAETPYIGIIGIEIDGPPDDGVVEWKLVDFEDVINMTGNVTVRIDDDVVLEKNISSAIHIVAEFSISPKGWTHFDLNGSEGNHRIEVVIVSENGVVDKREYTYDGDDIITGEEEEVEAEDEEEEDWLECP